MVPFDVFRDSWVLGRFLAAEFELAAADVLPVVGDCLN